MKGRRADATTTNVKEVWAAKRGMPRGGGNWESRQAPETAPFPKDDCSRGGSQPAARARAVGCGWEIAGNLARVAPPVNNHGRAVFLASLPTNEGPGGIAASRPGCSFLLALNPFRPKRQGPRRGTSLTRIRSSDKSRGISSSRPPVPGLPHQT